MEAFVEEIIPRCFEGLIFKDLSKNCGKIFHFFLRIVNELSNNCQRIFKESSKLAENVKKFQTNFKGNREKGHCLRKRRHGIFLTYCHHQRGELRCPRRDCDPRDLDLMEGALTTEYRCVLRS